MHSNITTPAGSNHVLGATVAGLVAVLLALTLYLAYTARHPATSLSTRPAVKQQLARASDPLPEWLNGLRGFTGTVKTISNGRLAVSLTYSKDGQVRNRTILVTLPKKTPIVYKDARRQPTEGSSATVTARTSSLKTGAFIEVQTREVIDNRGTVTAQSINILSI